MKLSKKPQEGNEIHASLKVGGGSKGSEWRKILDDVKRGIGGALCRATRKTYDSIAPYVLVIFSTATRVIERDGSDIVVRRLTSRSGKGLATASTPLEISFQRTKHLTYSAASAIVIGPPSAAVQLALKDWPATDQVNRT